MNIIKPGGKRNPITPRTRTINIREHQVLRGLCTDELVTNAKMSEDTIVPKNSELFHTVRRPPDAPREGTKAKRSNCLGKQVLMEAKVTSVILVSCRQTTAQSLEMIA